MTGNGLTSWLGQFAAWPWTYWAILVLALALLVMAFSWWMSRPTVVNVHDARKGRYTPTTPINRGEVEMLHYLQQAFPEEGVLFRPRLSQFLTPQRRSDRKTLAGLLDMLRVDFLVCTGEGVPRFAFDLDNFRTDEDTPQSRDAADKRHLLRQAGIRLIHLRTSARRMPPPDDLRERVMRTSPKSSNATKPAGFSSSMIGLSTFGGTLMAGRGDNSAWGDVRKRS
ncbi:MAG: DUF2726 domain-containing protein [Burkholderiaceae bacterium]|jgi:hypothetical protein|nr:DUF2726 domain-containing protein [Burkholderiaceae bacterium]